MRLRGVSASLRRLLLEPEPPPAGIEVRATGVSGMRLQRHGRGLALGAAAAFELPRDTLQLSLSEPNLRDPEAFRRALAALAERIGIAKGARVALVLPDAVGRVAFVPADEVRARSRAETEELLRFRLRKSLPFDVREARLAWVALPALTGRPAEVMVAALFAPVLIGYEEALREIGLVPGLVELSGLALLAALDDAPRGGDALLVNWDEGYVSLVLLRAGVPLLFRTLAGELAAQPAEVAREVANTILYYRERLGGQGLARAMLRSAALAPAEAAELLREPLGLAAEAIDPWRVLRGAPEGVSVHALAGAASALLAGAA